ncbi:hypothetical protein [Streptodolium elevatio]|uniref:Uncharacterized protein n=1 Tax=Streptodolium elevatio TaxID=3157996 RepID=A0ABV3DEP2_9ACTN
MTATKEATSIRQKAKKAEELARFEADSANRAKRLRSPAADSSAHLAMTAS